MQLISYIPPAETIQVIDPQLKFNKYHHLLHTNIKIIVL